jgi:hypothetical protein
VIGGGVVGVGRDLIVGMGSRLLVGFADGWRWFAVALWRRRRFDGRV